MKKQGLADIYRAALSDFVNRPRTEAPEDNNLSFYSGHTNFSFALVVSSGTVATLRGYKGAGLIWAVGLPLAALAGKPHPWHRTRFSGLMPSASAVAARSLRPRGCR